jgi:hypothetical protein
MSRTFAVAVLAACGGRAQHVEAIAPQHLETFVVADFEKGCPLAHRITVALDGAEVAAIDAGCKPEPVAHDGVIITDTTSPTFSGPAFDVAAGHHRIVAYDTMTGRNAEVSFTTPLLGSAAHPSAVGARADTVVIVVNDSMIGVGVMIRQNLILL